MAKASFPHQTSTAVRLVAGQPPSASNNSRIALENARRGVPVFPCYEAGPRAKQPRTLQGHHDATTDVMQVGSWWDRWPNSLVGIPTGSNTGFWVLDIDGPDGFDSLCTLIQKLGLTCISDLGNTLVRTPSGGLHIYFKLREGERPRSRARDIGPGIDTRGCKTDGSTAGYIIAAGCSLPDGRLYRLIDATDLQELGGAA